MLKLFLGFIKEFFFVKQLTTNLKIYQYV